MAAKTRYPIVKAAENGEGAGDGQTTENERDISVDPDAARRLREAVASGGGHGTVANATGIPGRTLSGLLRRGDAKFSQLMAISRATGYSLDWIATGRGSMRLEDASTPPDPQKSKALADPHAPAGDVLFGQIDVAALEEAITMALRVAAKGQLPRDPERLAKLLGALYTEVKENAS